MESGTSVAPGSPEPRGPVRQLVPIFAAMAMIAMGIGFTEPVIPLYALELDGTPFVASIIVAVRWGSRLLTNLPAGWYSDRYGRRPVTIAGAVAVALAALIATGAPNWQVLLASRVLEGLGVGALMTGILAMVTDGTQANVAGRARVFGYHQMIQRLGFWWGPAAGAALYGIVGARAVVGLCALLACAGALITLRAGETLAPLAAAPGRAPGPGRSGGLAAALRLLRRPAFLAGSLVAVGSFFTLTGTQFTALPLYVVEVRDWGSATLSLAMFLINAVGFALLYPSAWVADRYGRPHAIAGLAAMAVAGLVGLGLAGSPAGLLAASLLLGGTIAMRGPALQAFAMDLADRGRVGVTAGMYRALGDLGSALGPLGVALVAGSDYRLFFYLNAAVIGASTLTFVLATARQPPHPPAPRQG